MLKLAIFGGTFNPIHWGHIRVAKAIEQYVHFDEFLFVPCKSPVLNKPVDVSTEDRLEMLKIALSPYPQFKIDYTEIQRKTPSYMLETLQTFRHRFGYTASLTLIIGIDSFLQLPEWHQWEKLFELTHFIVVDRPDVQLEMPQLLQKELQNREVQNKEALFSKPFGSIHFFHAGLFPISSSEIRASIAQGKPLQRMLPAAVKRYIEKNHLYASNRTTG